MVVAVQSGSYHFESTGGIHAAAAALKTSKPADVSLNPASIDLSGAREVVRWDFRKEEDNAKWTTWHNLKMANRDGKAYLVATGADPQLVTELLRPLSGPLAIELRARPAKGATVQFFWASPSGGFNASQQDQRQLNPADQLNAYLFRIDDDQPLQKLRFDPFSNQGEMEIESLSIYQIDGT